VRAAGSRKWDVDGNEYLDYVMGHGALILGHSHPRIVEAVRAQVERGLHYGDNHALELEWAERIRELMPGAARIEYFASGQEANIMGIRIARAMTGRRKLLKFKYCYHGWTDELAGEGSPGTITDNVTVIPAGDPALLERHLASGEYAVALIEGGGARLAGRVPIPADFYRLLPEVARRYGTASMLDEVVTGFREAPGGWQSVVGMEPDLTSVGKAVGGGVPCGALLGRADLLEALSPDSSPARIITHGGTWNAVPVTCAAGITACELYRDGEPQRAARTAADRLRAEANARFERIGAPAWLYGRSVLHIYLGPVAGPPVEDGGPPLAAPATLMDPAAAPRYKRLDLHLLHRGVATTRGEAMILSAAHTERDIEETATALEAAVTAMIEEGTLGGARYE
jgi:glutamate-1-semialdehyde 2,1-aminomutase